MAGEAALLTCLAPDDGDAAFETFGGVRVWGPNADACRRGIEQLSRAIRSSLVANSSLDKNGLRFLVGKALGDPVEKKVIGAVLGAELRRGNVEEVLCASQSGKVFRTYVAASLICPFRDRLRLTREAVRERRRVKISEIRDRFFKRESGAWTQAAHLAAALVFDGSAIYVDKYHIAWPTGLENAFR